MCAICHFLASPPSAFFNRYHPRHHSLALMHSLKMRCIFKIKLYLCIAVKYDDIFLNACHVLSLRLVVLFNF